MDFYKKNKEKISKPAKNKRVVQYNIDIVSSSNDASSIITEILKNAGIQVIGCMNSNVSWSEEEYEQLTGVKID